MNVMGLRGWSLYAVLALFAFVVFGMVRNTPSIRNLGSVPIAGQGTPNIGGRGLL